jgi:putative phosphoribosyl transferase
VIVDDGVATGATARAACAVARGAGAKHVVLAVPVAPAGWESTFIDETDEVMSLFAPDDFGSVGYFYDRFEPISDDDVIALLMAPTVGATDALTEEDICEVMGAAPVDAHLVLAAHARAVALFVHGTGSSRASERNLEIARLMAAVGISGVLVDVPGEASGGLKSDPDVAVNGLVDVVRWIAGSTRFAGLPIVLVGSSSGAALAIATALSLRGTISVAAVISRGGNLSAVMDALGEVSFPVLLIVGSRDALIREQNARACAAIGASCRVEVVEGASHLFAEGDTLITAGRLAARFVEDLITR